MKNNMEIKFEDITDQQCVDIIAHFVKRKNANEIIIHTKTADDIVIKKQPRVDDYFDVMPPIVII